MINRLKRIRKAKGYTQSELAYMCSVSRETISRLEKNQYIPNSVLLMKLEYILASWVIQLDANELAEIQDRMNDVYTMHFPDECL